MSLYDFLGGSLSPKCVVRTLKYKMEFRRQHPTYFDPSGILVFCGPQGSGKTLSAVKYVRAVLAQYPHCILCTNVEIKGLPDAVRVIPYTGTDCFSDISNGEQGVIYLIDEIQIEFNSLESKNIDISIMTEIAQQRKQRKHIVGTSQVFARIAKPFREQFKYVVACKNFAGILQFNVLLDGESTIENDKGELESTKLKRFFWFHDPELYQSYDTYAKILRQNEIVNRDWRSKK